MQYQQFFRRFAIAGVASSVSLMSAFAASENPNLPNFHKVDDHVYRGAQPSDAGFQELSKLGIRTVIDLREIGEHPQAHEEAVVTGLGMRYLSIPMKGMSTPNDNQVANVLALFSDTTTGPIFVHCKRGADRTGMVVAVYRVAHDGWNNKTALNEAKENGMSFFERAIQHYVSAYKPPASKPSANPVVAAAVEVPKAAE
jgi:tyrosine-protein phosphatase SIW14